MNPNTEIIVVVKVIQHFEGLQYNRYKDTFLFNGNELSEFKIRRFIANNIDAEITPEFMNRMIQRLKIRCNELSRHN